MKNLIEYLEAAGQKEILDGTLFPLDLQGCTVESLVELGFELGSPINKLFRKGKLPSGWTLKDDQGSYHTSIYDEDGNHRGYISYKAAPYDSWARLSVK